MEKKQKTVVLGIIEDSDGRILMTERLDPKVKDAHKKRDIPGGTNEFGESLEETLTREIREETGLIVKDLEFLPKHHAKVRQHDEFLLHTLLFYYIGKWDGDTLKITDPKIGEVKWVSLDEALKLDLLETTTVFLQKYAETKRQ